MTGRLSTPFSRDHDETIRALAHLAAQSWKDQKADLGIENEMDFFTGFYARVIQTEPQLDTDACRNRFEQIAMWKIGKGPTATW